jgi:hypothetical protein
MPKFHGVDSLLMRACRLIFRTGILKFKGKISKFFFVNVEKNGFCLFPDPPDNSLVLELVIGKVSQTFLFLFHHLELFLQE